MTLRSFTIELILSAPSGYGGCSVHRSKRVAAVLPVRSAIEAERPHLFKECGDATFVSERPGSDP